MEKDDIVQLLEQCGLEAYKQAIGALIRPSLQLVLTPKSDEEIPPGSSKVGGCPDMPAEIEWPKWKNYYQSFIAQVNLAEIPRIEPLPRDGMLYFFYAIEPMYEADDFYEDMETCKVMYLSADKASGLQRRLPPAGLSEDGAVKPNAIECIPQLCPPASESADLENIGLGWNGNRDDFEKYWSGFLEKFRERSNTGDYIHRLLGHPDQIQGDMQISCERLQQGISWDTLREGGTYSRVLKSALDWRLLFQFDSEEEKTGIMFGDVGRIYFWIKEQDLLQRKFDHVLCEMQCC